MTKAIISVPVILARIFVFKRENRIIINGNDIRSGSPFRASQNVQQKFQAIMLTRISIQFLDSRDVLDDK